VIKIINKSIIIIIIIIIIATSCLFIL